MSNEQKASIEIQVPIQVTETKEESQAAAIAIEDSSMSQEMPTITTLLQRKKLKAAPSLEISLAENAAPPHEQQAIIDAPQSFVASEKSNGSFQVQGDGRPPTFTKTLVLESLALSGFQKQIKKHKKSGSMRKLDCLGFFSSRFSEMAYFEVNQAGILEAVLGFGNAFLVSSLRGNLISPQTLPSVFEMLAQGEIFVGSIESLRAEDQRGLSDLGFHITQCIGVFPIFAKKAVTGVWLCASAQPQEFTPKEIKALKGVFTSLSF